MRFLAAQQQVEATQVATLLVCLATLGTVAQVAVMAVRVPTQQEWETSLPRQAQRAGYILSQGSAAEQTQPLAWLPQQRMRILRMVLVDAEVTGTVPVMPLRQAQVGPAL